MGWVTSILSLVKYVKKRHSVQTTSEQKRISVDLHKNDAILDLDDSDVVSYERCEDRWSGKKGKLHWTV